MSDYTQEQIEAALNERHKWPGHLRILWRLAPVGDEHEAARLWLWHKAQIAAAIERCIERCEARAQEHRRVNVEEAKTSYAKGKTYLLAHECDAVADALRADLAALRQKEKPHAE